VSFIADCRVKSHTQKKFQNNEDEFKQKKKLHIQKRIKQHEQLEKQSAMNLEFLKTLNVKKCMLKIQSMMLEKFAAEKNQLKKLVKVSELMILNFDK